MGEEGNGSRPSFASYWKKGKQKLKGKGSAAASASPTSDQQAGSEGANNASPTTKAQTAKEKSQLRRAQVRRAQIQHRQRKANYTKQLELDVSQLRDLVALTEKEAAALLLDNSLMRRALENAGVAATPLTTSRSLLPGTVSLSPEDALQQMQLDPPPVIGVGNSPAIAEQSPELFGDIDIDDLTVTLSMDNALGTPCFHISSNSSVTSITGNTSPQGNISGGGAQQLSTEQEQRVVNFILGLEHCCWDHFWLGDSHLHDDHPDSESEKGHTLTASAYCMASAPDNVYSDRSAFQSKFKPNPTLTWGMPSLTLDSLHGLASSLNPGDLEITPVQAWFELASRYPVELLMAGDVMDRLQREFNGVTKFQEHRVRKTHQPPSLIIRQEDERTHSLHDVDRNSEKMNYTADDDDDDYTFSICTD
ncbi:hypothetical protein QQS21_001552 [Conoideocrella luteorostrata]|uniref:BZIP domain-containing protein n=1 Tax=Conoideocrella luteorostrata TaxID=1105319 RepID=A0AAJ0FY62_9HYPO|nr:hypothetical protein QQS21_001552 [Conoideocrella luteorostrata]